MVTRLDADRLFPQVARVAAVLSGFDPVTQQQILELTCVRHALQMGNAKDARVVVDSMHKHILQIMQERAAFP